MNRRFLFVLALFGWLVLWGAAQAQTQNLFATNSFWVYRPGTNEVSSPIHAWRTNGFDTTGWLSGRAPFHYGENITGGTLLTNMRGNYSCIYLIRTFFVPDKNRVGQLTLNALSDDGFIAWINGVEVARYSAPDGEPVFTSVASSSAPEPVALLPYALPDPRGYLVTGDNVIAVQAFNQSLAASSDFQFNASLVSTPPDTTPPVIAQVFPPPGRVPSLNQVTVTFSEPVTGVDASDFWINGTPSRSVDGGGSVYTFSFDTPTNGFAAITWFTGHGVTDLSFQANAFDSTPASANWAYQILDDQPPQLKTIHPPANATIRSLSQIEVTFGEPVEGVRPSDLLVNGQPAVGVRSASPSSFIFELPALAPGQVVVTWSPDHAITDLQEPPNRFLGATWDYSVIRDAPAGDVVINEFLVSNVSTNGLRDEDRELEGWIELYNRGAKSVDLTGWSLTDDRDVPDQWVFPTVILGANQYLVVFASGKDRRSPSAGGRFHTNFKLGVDGEYLALFNADSPRRAATEIAPRYPAQRNDFSYGRDAAGDWRFLRPATPGAVNGASAISGVVDEPRFSVQRGFFNQPFNLSLSCATPGASIRYTTNGTPPTETTGFIYLNPINIRGTTLLRAVAFLSNSLPSKVVTHTYLMGLSGPRLSLPAISIVTASNSLRGFSGIMETNPRNTTRRGIAWERSASAEFIRPSDQGGFQIDCGLRVQGGDYIRGLYDPNSTTPPQGKFSFRLYFRGDYGPGKLSYPLFEGSSVREFDRIVLRAGMNDPTNPFIVDEMMRRLLIDTGQVTTRGTHAHLFLNGVYKGYYNVTEGYEEDFFQSWHGGKNGWDLITQGRIANSGDVTAFNNLYNLVVRSNMVTAANYALASRQLDMTNFVDYLLVNIYGGTGDWPNNNWRAARERVAGARFRFYMWDAEWSLGNLGRSVTLNTLTSELANGSEIATLFQRLRVNREFQMLFADRVQKHFFNGGALTDDRVRNHFNALREEMRQDIPGLQTSILTSWIPRRRTNVFGHLRTPGLIASTNAPGFNQHGGRVPPGFQLALTNAGGSIYYTLDGSDPRVPVSEAVASGAALYSGSPLVVSSDLVVRTRAKSGTNWSALTEASFQVGRLGPPIRFTEIMHSPEGGAAYEFIELRNVSGTSFDIGHFSMEGVNFTFTENTLIPPGETIVIGSAVDPRSFSNRYSGIKITGWFGGSLSSSGERIALKDASGRVVESVDYGVSGAWPAAASAGASLEVVDPDGDPDAPSNWRASARPGGTPGSIPAPAAAPDIRLNELLAFNVRATANAGTYPDWVELHNAGSVSADLSGWSLTDGADPRKFIFPVGTRIAPGGYLTVWCDNLVGSPGLHTGFLLDGDGESLTLYDGGTNRIDAVEFGAQVADLSLGRVGAQWVLTHPSPGRANVAAALAPETDLVVNEWFANPSPGETDWIELYNRNSALPIALKGLYLSTSNAVHRITSYSFVAPRGYLKLVADEQPGSSHLDFKLPSAGGMIALHDRTGGELERVVYGPQKQGFSEGKLPDGGASRTLFPASGTGGTSNVFTLYTGPMLNEITAAPGASDVDPWGGHSDWIELFNPNNTAWDLTGMSLSTGRPQPGEWSFPSGAQVPPGGYLVVWMASDRPASSVSLSPLNTGMALSDRSDAVYLFNRGGQWVDSVEFGFQISGLTIGRAGGAWQLLRQPTPGGVNSAASSLGSSAELKINEWLASSLEGEDWFEVHNPSLLPVALAGHFLTDDPSISGVTNFVVGPLSFIGPQGYLQWICDGDQSKGWDHLPFHLDDRGETLRLYSPSLALIDGVDFGPQAQGVSEGRLPDGSSIIVHFNEGPTPRASNSSVPTGRLRLDLALSRDGNLSLKFSALAGRSYAIEGRFSLGAGRWERLESIPAGAIGRTVERVFSASSGTERYFRLVLLP